MIVTQPVNIILEQLPNHEVLNPLLEADIRAAGDSSGSRTAAKCYRTRWDMHEIYPSFEKLCDGVIDVCKRACGLATNEDGTPKDYNLKTHDSWGLIYKKGDTTNAHQHYPCLWSWTYCVSACEGCSPLVFPTSEGKNEIEPENGQLIMWPSHVLHEVPKQVCSHERVMIAGDIIFDSWV